MGYITWTDEEGSATLSNLKPKPARRFSEWTPDIDRVSDRRATLGQGVTYEFHFRQDFIASFAMDYLPVTQLALVARFKRWALKGCSFFVYTEDEADRVHLCRLQPGTDVELEMADRTLLEYRVAMSVMSAENPPEFLTCIYRS